MLALLQPEGLVCGVDEAGRGPLAGPVVAAAVILDPARPIAGLNDSKQLSARSAGSAGRADSARALAWAVAEASVEEIDRINILQASLLAMQRAVAALVAEHGLLPVQVLVDGNRCPNCVPGGGHRRRRWQDCRYRGGVDSRQDRPRRRHARTARSLSAVRL
jgi:ribonuclease HII